MAKKKGAILIRLKSEARGFFYITKKSSKLEKLKFKKYDPVVRKHVMFKETKI